MSDVGALIASWSCLMRLLRTVPIAMIASMTALAGCAAQAPSSGTNAAPAAASATPTAAASAVPTAAGSADQAAALPKLTGQTLTVYSGQHEQTTKALVADFEKATGVTVALKSGDESELAGQLLEED